MGGKQDIMLHNRMLPVILEETSHWTLQSLNLYKSTWNVPP